VFRSNRLVACAIAAIALLNAMPVAATGGSIAYGFDAPLIEGFPTGAAALSGGGAFNLQTGSVDTAGGFRCLADVAQGPLAGCLAGQGIRWDTADLLASTTFKCTGAAEEALKVAESNPTTAVILADLYRAGDGTDESFTARMIVSQGDIAPDLPGVQNVWLQGVGCGAAVGSFNLGSRR
jgi:hypothetical protein